MQFSDSYSSTSLEKLFPIFIEALLQISFLLQKFPEEAGVYAESREISDNYPNESFEGRVEGMER